MSSGKSKTMPMQIFWGLKRCIMGFVQVVNKVLILQKRALRLMYFADSKAHFNRSLQNRTSNNGLLSFGVLYDA